MGLKWVLSQHQLAGLKSHNLLRIERWKRFGTTVLKDLLLHTLRFESQGNMFVVKGPGSKELLTRNWKKAPRAVRHQTLHRGTNNLISWNIPEIKKAEQMI